MMYTPVNKQAGFSFVETLVAITILLIVIIGPLTISSNTAKSTSFSSEQVVAFFLAEEGAEIAQKVRDDLLLRNQLDVSDGNYVAEPWGVFTDTSGTFSACYISENENGCALEYSNGNNPALEPVTTCTAGGCPLYYDETDGERTRYTKDSVGNDETIYTRTLYFETAGLVDQVKVTSKVTWFTTGQRKAEEVHVETYLFNVYGDA